MENKGLTISQIIVNLWNKKFFLLGFTVGFMIIGLLFTSLIYNKSNAYYEGTVEISFPGVDEFTYPDGEKFYYRDIISLDSLSNVKNSNVNFKNINTSKMSEHDDIAIYNTTTSIDGKTVEVPGVYKIVMKASYFKNKTQARDFYKELINYKMNAIYYKIDTANFNYLIEMSKTAISYENSLDLLVNQKLLIIEEYDKILEDYGNITVNEKRISDYKKEFEINSPNLDYLYSTLENKGYVKDIEAERDSLEGERIILQNERDDNAKIISELSSQINTSAGEGYLPLTTLMAEKIERNAELDRLIVIIDKKLSSTDVLGNKKFSESLNDAALNIEEYTNIFTNVYKEIGSKKSNISYYSNSIVALKGDMNNVVGVILFGILGAILSASVITIIKVIEDSKE